MKRNSVLCLGVCLPSRITTFLTVKYIIWWAKFFAHRLFYRSASTESIGLHLESADKHVSIFTLSYS